MLQIILLIVVVAIVALSIIVALQSADFHIVRCIIIDSPAEKAFAQVNDFRKWAAWSPWEKVDPSTKKIYEGAASGIGAKYAWIGNRKVGSGNMEITDVRPNELIRIRLEFTKPMKAVHTTDFTFEEENGRTIVTQSMYGKNGFLGKAISLVMNMENMIGPMFEKGLSDMKKTVEAGK